MRRIASKRSSKTYIYGPVPSRRLGYSLGIDTLPFKTCTFNCIYCQLGRTTTQTIRRHRFIPAQDILRQLKKTLKQGNRIDYITFSGSGEPTLYTELGRLIKKIKEITNIPVAVITNSSLLTKPCVQNSLLMADVVLPTLTSASEQTFKFIHRPHSGIKVRDVIEGLVKFRQIYHGQIWLELMMVKGVNDSREELRSLKKAIERIRPDRIQLNTVVRPPSESYARPLSLSQLERIKRILGRGCEIVAEFKKPRNLTGRGRKEDQIIQYLKRRPGTKEDIKRALGLNEVELSKYLFRLLSSGRIKKIKYRGKDFYEPI